MATESVQARDEVELDRIWTIPNALSVARLVLLGIALAVLFASHQRVLAAALLAIAGATDFLDGYVARRIHQVSRIGKVLDPTVDRMVLTGSIIAILVYGAVPIWIGIVVLAREVFVSLVVLGFAAAGAARRDVLWIGKAGTFGLLVAFPLFLVGDGPGSFAHALHDVAYVISLPSLAAAIAAAVAYLLMAPQALVEGRRAREDGV